MSIYKETNLAPNLSYTIVYDENRMYLDWDNDTVVLTENDARILLEDLKEWLK